MLVGLSCWLCIASASAQQIHPIPAPSRALLFEVNKTSLLQPFQGLSIALQWQRSPRRAWRLGLDLAGSTGSSQDTRTITDTSGVLTFSVRTRDNDEGVTVHALRLWYGSTSEQIKSYAGVGPVASWSRLNHRSDDVTFGRLFKSRDIRWTTGIELVAGAEWMVTDRIGIQAEYRAAGSYAESVRNDEFAYPVTSTQDRDRNFSHHWSAGGTGVTAAISAYFGPKSKS